MWELQSGHGMWDRWTDGRSETNIPPNPPPPNNGGCTEDMITGTVAKYQSDAGSTKDTPCLTLTGKLWGVFCEYLWEKLPRYNGTTLYQAKYRLFCSCFTVFIGTRGKVATSCWYNTDIIITSCVCRVGPIHRSGNVAILTKFSLPTAPFNTAWSRAVRMVAYKFDLP